MSNTTETSAELLSNIENLLLCVIINNQDIICNIINEDVNYIYSDIPTNIICDSRRI